MAQQLEERGGFNQAWETLLAQYGEAMIRAAKSEAEAISLHEKIDALQGKSLGDHGFASQLERKDTELQRQKDSISSLQVQIQVLSSELADARTSMRHNSRGNRPPTRRGQPRRWWQFWRPQHRRSHSSTRATTS